LFSFLPQQHFLQKLSGDPPYIPKENYIVSSVKSHVFGDCMNKTCGSKNGHMFQFDPNIRNRVLFQVQLPTGHKMNRRLTSFPGAESIEPIACSCGTSFAPLRSGKRSSKVKLRTGCKKDDLLAVRSEVRSNRSFEFRSAPE